MKYLWKSIFIFLTPLFLTLTFFSIGQSESQNLHWMKIKAKDKYERSRLTNLGLHIEVARDDYVVAFGTLEEKNAVEKMGVLETSFPLNSETMDFPSQDEQFHNYSEMVELIEQWRNKYSDILSIEVIGKSIEGRDIFNLRISTDLDSSHTKPAIAFMGGHHAREHLSIETPLNLAEHLLSEFQNGNERIVGLLNSREIHIIPMVNPDGAEHDIASGRYRMWRKNRRLNSSGAYGVDLNRNYSFQWGTGGSSNNPSSDTYMGKQPFSEPETTAIKNFVESHENITILLSFHTFSELILYPWGHKYDSISDDRDLRVHQTMARKMATWNGYTPQQSSGLYIASGDTTDWSYGAHRIISFTFELDPASMWDGGFYPGQAYIPRVFQKNLEPCLYLIEYSDNPYRVIDGDDFSPGIPSNNKAANEYGLSVLSM